MKHPRGKKKQGMSIFLRIFGYCTGLLEEMMKFGIKKRYNEKVVRVLNNQ